MGPLNQADKTSECVMVGGRRGQAEQKCRVMLHAVADGKSGASGIVNKLFLVPGDRPTVLGGSAVPMPPSSLKKEGT